MTDLAAKLCSCGYPATHLCDMPILAKHERMNWEQPLKQLCNAPLCELCRNQISEIRFNAELGSETYDLCKRHFDYKKHKPHVVCERVENWHKVQELRHYKAI